MRRIGNSARSKSGNAMIEYAMLAPVFFMLVGGLIEFVLYQYKSYALNNVVYEVARNLQTGEIQAAGSAEAMADAFHDEACLHASTMIDCEAIVFDVRTFDAIEDVTYPEPVYDDEGNPVSFVFEPGGASTYSVVRAAIHHQFITPFMAELFSMGVNEDGEDLAAILTSFCIVRNEPWA
ncbi:MAG: TadE/TadG family type IV pilus assembly protein [Alphaproteobacteria bacterium]|nr:TadE/TadG family type IV pilus assembly protein [Alphaproteobacteria bacterium]